MRQILTAVVLVFLAMSPVAGQGVPEALAPFRGMNDTLFATEPDQLLQDPVLGAALERLLGPDTVGLLAANLQVHSPPEIIDGHLVVTGNRPRMGNQERASLWFRLFDGAPRAIVMTEGKVTAYADVEKFEYLPNHFRTLVREWQALGLEPPRHPPAGVTWRRSVWN